MYLERRSTTTKVNDFLFVGGRPPLKSIEISIQTMDEIGNGWSSLVGFVCSPLLCRQVSHY